MRTAVKKWKRDDQKKFRQIRREVKALIKIKKSTIPPKLENLFLITLNACGPSSNLWQNRIAHLPFWEAANILYLTTKTKHTFWHNWFPLETIAPTTQANLFYHHTEVAKVLNNIDPAKAPGPDNISGRLLKETAPEISVSLCRLFNLAVTGWILRSVETGTCLSCFQKRWPSASQKLLSNFFIIYLVQKLWKVCFQSLLSTHFASAMSPATRISQWKVHCHSACSSQSWSHRLFRLCQSVRQSPPLNRDQQVVSLLYIRPVETMVPELSLQQISESSATGYLFQLASTYFWSSSSLPIGPFTLSSLHRQYSTMHPTSL